MPGAFRRARGWHSLAVARDAGTVAVVVPFYGQDLTGDECLSLRHLNRFLSSYDRYLAAPKSLRFRLDGFRAARFADRYFESRRGYSALMLSREFYRAFSSYEYVLIYQLDCLVFADELLYWCDREYDYIGAVHTIGDRPRSVGNGGFSLRRIPSFLGVLESNRREVDPGTYWAENFGQRPAPGRWKNLPRKYAKHLRAFNGVQWEVRRINRAYSGWAEDWFWSLEAKKYLPSFRIAPNDDGLRFAFDERPREAYEANGRQLPFGCHGWSKHDREFWEPYLLVDGRVGAA
jgi:hypothetical protein